MPNLTPEAGLAWVRRAIGDDRAPFMFADAAITTAIADNGGNLDLAAAELRDLVESRSGEDLGAAWGRRTDQLRQKGYASIDAGGRQPTAHRAGGS